LRSGQSTVSHRAHGRHAGRRVGAGEDGLAQLAAALRLQVIFLLEEGEQRAHLREEALRHGRIEEEDVHPRPADREEVLGVAQQLRLVLAVGQPRLDPLSELLADGIALGPAERAVLGHLVDERTGR